MYKILTKTYRSGTPQGLYSSGKIECESIASDQTYSDRKSAENALAAHRKIRMENGYGATDYMYVAEVANEN